MPCPSALRAVHDSSTRRRRGMSRGAEAVRTLLCLWGHTPARCCPPSQQRPRRDSVGAAATPPDGVGRVRSQSTWALGAACQVGRPRAISRGRKKRAATASGAGRRLLSTPSASAPPARLLVVGSVTGPEAMALLADNETAQEPQHGCGDDCSRSASLAALHAPSLALH